MTKVHVDRLAELDDEEREELKNSDQPFKLDPEDPEAVIVEDSSQDFQDTLEAIGRQVARIRSADVVIETSDGERVNVDDLQGEEELPEDFTDIETVDMTAADDMG